MRNATLFDAMKKRIQSTISSREQTPQSLLKLAGVSAEQNGISDLASDMEDATNTQHNTSHVDSLGSTDAAKRMVRWHAEALGRATELCAGHEM